MQAPVLIRPIEAPDDPEVEALIRAVMPEFGADGPGTALHDPEVSAMSQAYARPRAAYFVARAVALPGLLLAGAGIAPLEAADGETAELRKMYCHPEGRGLGVGRALLERCLDTAREVGYRRIYLETLPQMTRAHRLYERAGFQRLSARRGDTGHSACHVFYQLELGPGA